MLAQASSYEAAGRNPCDEAAMLLMRTRLMDSAVWASSSPKHEKHRRLQQQADLQQLKNMGFRYVLSPKILCPSSTRRSSIRRSDRVHSSHVSAFENSLQVKFFVRAKREGHSVT
jgi:hypothetical protein